MSHRLLCILSIKINYPDILIKKDDIYMKIGINAVYLNDTPTGIGNFTKEVIIRICRNLESIVYAPMPLGQCKIKDTPKSICGSKKLLDNLRRLFYINTVLPHAIKKEKIHMLYCPIAEVPFKDISIPVVVTVHDLHPIYFEDQFGLSSKYFKITLSLLPKIASRITVPSLFVKYELIRHSRIKADKIDVVYNGYDSCHFKPMDEDKRQGFLSSYNIKRPYILFVGSLFEYKNLKVLIKAFMNIKDKIGHNLIVIGKREVATEKLYEDERIIYLDYVRYEDLPYFYSYADVFVHPAFFEGFGLSVLEAMACGTAVISSSGGSLPEVVGDGGLLFDPNDSTSLSSLMLKVINDGDFRQKIVQRGLVRSSQFSWDKTAKGLIEVFHKVI